MPRANQQLRTRKDLLLAASRLLKSGKTPTMDEVAEEAMVSRATAYRYFPDIQSLLIEAPLDESAPTPESVFDGGAADDPLVRIDMAEAALHGMTCRNEAQLRLMLACSLRTEDGAKKGKKGPAPRRQNRRTALIQEALRPVRGEMDDDTYETLCAALAIVFGIESMVVFRDVLGVGADEARRVKRWAIRALVEQALSDSGGR